MGKMWKKIDHFINRRPDSDFIHLRIITEKDLENVLHKYHKRAIYMPMRDNFLHID
jgi:hypothetical protein